jgi:AAA domain
MKNIDPYQSNRFSKPLLTGEQALASYTKKTLPEFHDNPLIEALPPRLDMFELSDLLTYNPDLNDVGFQVRELDSLDRIDAVYRVRTFFEPLSMHIELYSRIHRMLHWGYVGRNPLLPSFQSELRKGLFKKSNVQRPITNSFPQGTGFNLIGGSGNGKIWGLERILKLWPQVIRHNSYGKRRFGWIQLVWLKLDCPRDGNVSGLCISFFAAVDQILKTNYAEVYSIKKTINAMVEGMAQVALVHSIGMLVIDEIQHLVRNNTKRTDESGDLLNTIVTLTNKVGFPIILIGTYRAFHVLSSAFREGRRGAGQGDYIWDRLWRESKDWKLFVESLWSHQYTATITALNNELNDTLYDVSRGIVDIACKVYMLAQSRAIAKDDIEITPKLLYRVAFDSMNLTKQALNNLRKLDNQQHEKSSSGKDYSELLSLGDLILPTLDNVDFEGWVQLSRESISFQSQLQKPQIMQQAVANSNEKLKIVENSSNSDLKTQTAPGSFLVGEAPDDGFLVEPKQDIKNSELCLPKQHSAKVIYGVDTRSVIQNRRKNELPHEALSRAGFTLNLSIYAN